MDLWFVSGIVLLWLVTVGLVKGCASLGHKQ